MNNQSAIIISPNYCFLIILFPVHQFIKYIIRSAVMSEHIAYIYIPYQRVGLEHEQNEGDRELLSLLDVMAVGGNICMIRAMGNCHVRVTSKALVMGEG